MKPITSSNMSRIRFSDQVLSNEDVSLTAAGGGPQNGGAVNAAANGRRHTYAMRGRGGSIQLSDLGGPASNMAVGRSPSRRSLDRPPAFHRAPPSIAASDTSSAAGFRPSSRLHHSSSVEYQSGMGGGGGPLRPLCRSYAVDAGDYGNGNGGVNALFPRSTQDYLDELEYRGSLGGSAVDGSGGGPPPPGVPPSVTTSSPYSPRSGDSSAYNPGTTPQAMPPILKNGTLPRSRAGSAYSTGGNGGPLIGGTLERGHSRLSVNNAGYANTDFGGRPPSRGMGNGSVAGGSVSSYGGGGSPRMASKMGNHHPHGNGSLRRPGPARPNQLQHRGGGHITANPMVRNPQLSQLQAKNIITHFFARRNSFGKKSQRYRSNYFFTNTVE